MIPDEIKIGMRTVKVLYADMGNLNEQGALMGQYDPNALTITLNSQMTDRALLMETFWHELVHAINDKIRFDFELSRELQTEQNVGEFVASFNETFTESFSQTLMQVLADNKMLPMAIPQQ